MCRYSVPINMHMQGRCFPQGKAAFQVEHISLEAPRSDGRQESSRGLATSLSHPSRLVFLFQGHPFPDVIFSPVPRSASISTSLHQALPRATFTLSTVYRPKTMRTTAQDQIRPEHSSALPSKQPRYSLFLLTTLICLSSC